jgi:hypothetical protein
VDSFLNFQTKGLANEENPLKIAQTLAQKRRRIPKELDKRKKIYILNFIKNISYMK